MIDLEKELIAMTELEAKIHRLDAAYKPFPTFLEWASRTSVERARWDRYNAALQQKRDVSGEALRRAREIVKRAAALDTGAIEGLYEVDRGFTFTVAFETSAWEVEIAKRGENVRPLFEAQMHAYDYVLDLATKAEPISEAAIRTLHEVVCAAQSTYRVATPIGFQEQELVKGRYKILPNHVRTRDGVDHSYAPVDITPAEMQRLVLEMRSQAFLDAHPVIQAAYAHYGLVVIHPFADGNGRVARALASAFTYRAVSMPIMILSEQKEAYLDALEAADDNDYQSFVEFMLARALDTITVVSESMLGALSPKPEQGLGAIDRLYTTKGGYTQQEVDACGARLQQLLMDEFTKVFSRSSSPNVRYHSSFVDGGRGPSDAVHRLPFSGARRLEIRLDAVAPAKAVSLRTYHLFLPKDADADDDVQLEQADGKESFVARVCELIPSVSGILQIRLGLFAERVAGVMLSELRAAVERVLREQR
ncbi:MAG TPA: Fic family protein [Terracidiphilus sp.]|nr:Fic family protein [Terracidiphilus sp.]